MSQPLSPTTQLALMRPMPRATVPQEDEPPRDCVRSFPTLDPGTTELVGFDSSGKPRIKIQLPSDDVSEEWERWIMRYIRRKESRRIHIVK